MKLKKNNGKKFLNGEIHNWYHIVLGYSDQLVNHIIEKFQLDENSKVLDPFCGSGTTLIECMKNGIPSIGIDANPSSVFASKVKTQWDLDHEKLLNVLNYVEKIYKNNSFKNIFDDPTYIYLKSSGMIDRGWICIEPLKKALTIKTIINQIEVESEYKDKLLLALIAEVVYGSSNVKFGPELYCSKKKVDSDVLGGFISRVQSIANDLSIVNKISHSQSIVVQGDARNCDKLFLDNEVVFSSVICSPPYPTEHDYTRNSRLELAFLEHVLDKKSLQLIKKEMIRSHTKGIYKFDRDSDNLEFSEEIEAIVGEIQIRIKSKTHGFARLYPKVVKEYFGGMKRHLFSIHKFLNSGSKCAYVVGDQSSYLRVHIPTAEILSSIANKIGYETLDIEHWRDRWSSITSKEVKENILFLKKI